MAYESCFDYDGNVKPIKKVTFGILSPEIIRKQSVVEVIYHDTFCGNSAVTGGLFDPRMGVFEYGQLCPTDRLSNKETPGYFGHIELALPVFHNQYFNYVQKILRSICYKCSEPLFETNHEGGHLKQKLAQAVEKSKKRHVCEHCKAVQPEKYVKTDLCKVHASWPDGTQLVMSPSYVLGLFKLMSDETCRQLGFDPKLSHPKWMILEAFPVIPPSCRPTAHQESGQRMEDDITIKYCDIIKYNKMISDKMKSDPSAKIIQDWHNLLQYHTSTLIDNEIAGILPSAQRSGRPLKGLRQRLKGKDGRIRGNLMGKRVNFSSRTVITPDPIIDIDQLGVPKRIAVLLTRPEKVTEENISRMRSYIRNGCNVHPGARSVFKKRTNKTISLNHIDRYQFASILEVGDIVIRHIINDDWVLFNRQPSLHKMSMMAHRVKVLDGLTFRLNISATTPYNADFDGDEMNMHVPQSACTSNEIASLASVNNQILSPALNVPIITFVQDAVLGGHIMTMPESTRFTHRELMNILSWTNKGNIPEKSHFTGKEALSYCLPRINLKMRNRKGEQVIIQNGKILEESGCFDKKVFTQIIHSLYHYYGAKTCAEFFNGAQHIIRAYLVKNSTSVGVKDLALEPHMYTQIRETIVQQKLEVDKTIQTLHLQMCDNNSIQAFESKVNKSLTSARSAAENLLKKEFENVRDNRFMNMVDGGSKGKLINLAQMTACLGQQAIDGQRVPYGFSCRTLPHFTKFDDSAYARGFVHSSFQKGMDSLEFFFHAMAGREGIIDTAVKTSNTGYIQRKLMKSLEDFKVTWSGAVKDAQDNVIQFLYGDDNADSIYLEYQSVPIVENGFDIEKRYLSDFNEGNSDIMKGFVKELESMREWYITQVWNNVPELQSKFPINIQRLLNNIKSSSRGEELTVKIILDSYENLLRRLRIHPINDGMWMLRFMLYMYADPKTLISRMNFSVSQFNEFIENIEQAFWISRIDPGDAVGPVAAQSIGEPCTQLTLNTFHLAGVGSKSNVTRGVPRLQELFHMSKAPKKSSLTIRISENSHDKERTQRVANEFVTITLKDVLESSKIVYEKNTDGLQDFYALEKEFNDFMSIDTRIDSPWVLQYTLNKTTMLEKCIEVEEIYSSMRKMYSETSVLIEFSDDNAPVIFMRIKVDPTFAEFKKMTLPNQIHEISILATLHKKFEQQLVIRGIQNIVDVNVRQDIKGGSKEWVIDTDGTNLIDAMIHPNVDGFRTISNDIFELYSVFGIEAARNTLIYEIKEVMDEASEIDPRHIHLLVDMMTTKGILVPIDRNGMKLTDVGPLAKCSFEEADQQLYKAAVYGESDDVQGVSAHIILGQAPPCGTGTVDVSVVEDEMNHFFATSDPVSKTETLSFDVDM